MSNTFENCYSLHGFPDKAIIEPKFSNEEYHEYLRLNSDNLEQSSTTLSLTTCITQFVESKSMDN